MKLLRSEQGFSLVELMIALTILAIGMLGVLGMQVYAIRGNAFATNMSLAQSIAQQKLEYLRNLSYITVKGSSGAGYFGVPFGTRYQSQAAVPVTDLPADDYITNFTADDALAVDVEGYGQLRADHQGGVFQDNDGNGTPDAPFDRFRRVTIIKLIDETPGGDPNIAMVVKVLVYWRGATAGTEHRAVLMTMRAIGD